LIAQLLGRELGVDFDRMEGTDFGIVCLGSKGFASHQLDLTPQLLARQAEKHSWPLVIVLLPGATCADLSPTMASLPAISYSPIDNSDESISYLFDITMTEFRS
jgi:hypothetical protein